MQGDHERETENQQQRVSQPSEARRIKEPRGKQKVTNKESVTPERRIEDKRNHRNMGKRKFNNKEPLQKSLRDPQKNSQHQETLNQLSRRP